MTEDWYDVAVIGGGPGGYVAAIRAAQLGGKILLVEKSELGGVCTNVGCIPTKTILRGIEFYTESKVAEAFGLRFTDLSLDYRKLLEKKGEVVKRLREGIQYLLKVNGVSIEKATGSIPTKGKVSLVKNEGTQTVVSTESIIVATGSNPKIPPIMGIESKGVMTSDQFLNLEDVPRSILIVGGGAEGCEFASMLNPVGCKVIVVEMLETLIPNEDRDIGLRLSRVFERSGVTVHCSSKVKHFERIGEILHVSVESPKGEVSYDVEKVLLGAGRSPNVDGLGLDALGVRVGPSGILVDEHMETDVKGVFAVGDVVGGGLAHVAFEGGIVAAENSMGLRTTLDLSAVPRCIYTSPEVAAVGLSEAEAQIRGYRVSSGRFPLQASGRAYTLGETEGFAKVVCEAESNRLLGVHIIGKSASEIISGPTLALKMKARAEDLAETIYPHPTLSEAVREAALDVLNRALHTAQRRK